MLDVLFMLTFGMLMFVVMISAYIAGHRLFGFLTATLSSPPPTANFARSAQKIGDLA